MRAGDAVLRLGSWTVDHLDSLLRESRRHDTAGRRIDLLSRALLGTPYGSDTLSRPDEPEAFIVDLGRVDCFTFLDYVEALGRSAWFNEFLENLRSLRYRDNTVSYTCRRHFFTDWLDDENRFIAGPRAIPDNDLWTPVEKRLNEGPGGRPWVPGISPADRIIHRIPPDRLDAVLPRLATGDYIGIFSETPGLDVSHTGIYITGDTKPVFRHASSKEGVMRVVDEPFIPYVRETPGIVLIRPSQTSGP